MDLHEPKAPPTPPPAGSGARRRARRGRALAVLVCALAAAGAVGCVTAPAAAPAAPAAARAQAPDCHRVESERFAFHSDPWINLHHFLFQWARSEAERLPGDRRHPVEVAERAELERLDPAERRAWAAALAHYRERLVARDLLWDRGLIALRDPLGAIACSAGSPDGIAAELRPVLVAAMPVYRRHWWPRHDATNRAWIGALLVDLAPHEGALAERLSVVYGGGWPPERLRVDVGAYANHTAAYTTNGPDQVTVASTHPHHRGLNAVEVLFHEASHASWLEQPLLAQLDAAFRPRGAEPPQGLSHVVQFVTPAALLRSRLAAEERSEFRPYGELAGLYRRDSTWDRYRQVLERHWVPYLDGRLERAEALERIVSELARS